MSVLIILFFILALSANIFALSRIRLASLTFLDGVVIGMVYYLTVPMIVILLSGRISPDFMPIPEYRPYEDIQTSFVIEAAIIFISGARLLAPRSKMPDPRRDSYPITYVVIAILVLYFGSTLVSARMLGSANGTHWFKASNDLANSNANYLLLKVVANFSRTAIFGCLAGVLSRTTRHRTLIVLVAVMICVFDLALTFNRISVAYFLLVVLVAYRRHVFSTSVLMAAALLSATFVSSLWTEVRGLVSVYGSSVTGFTNAITVALTHADEQKPFVDEMNGVFESINIVAFNYVVQNTDRLGVSPSAYFIRPLTLFIPKNIFPDRPPSFASVLGVAISGSKEAALNSTLIGEPYASSSWLWPIMLIGVILFYNYCYKLLGRANSSYGPIGAVIAFALWRFDSSFAAYSLIFCVLIHLVLRFTRLIVIQLRGDSRRLNRSLTTAPGDMAHPSRLGERVSGNLLEEGSGR